VAAANLSVGESVELPDGTTVAFTGFREFAALQYSHDPGQVWVLGSAIALLLGLLGMLLVRRERVFARVTGPSDDGGTVLAVASLLRGSGESAARFAALSADLDTALAARSRPSPPEVSSRDS
jgi:cytochrome c biogenesis protein